MVLIRSTYAVALLTLLALICIGALAQGQTPEEIKYSSWLAKRPPISEIVITGNEFYTDSRIRSQLFSRKHTFWQRLKSGQRDRVLRYTAIRDTMEIKYLYLIEGFLNISAREEYEIIPKDSSARVIIHIDEGPRFTVGTVTLVADDSLNFYNDLWKVSNRIETGDPVNPILLKEIVFNLKTVYANNGYPYAQVGHIFDTTGGPGYTAVTFHADQGPLVYFGKLIVSDMHYYSPHMARREITFREGDLYRRDEIIESQKRLYSTSLFNSINLSISREDQMARDTGGVIDLTPDFVFSAIERKPYFLTTQTGVSQDSLQDLTWDFSSALGKRNIFISRRMELSFKFRFIIFTQWRTLYHRYQIKFTEPWFLGLRMPVSTTVRFEPGVRSQLQDYRIETWSVGLSTRKEWSEQLYALINGWWEQVNIYGIAPEDQDQFRSEQGISIRRKLDVTLIRDTRLDKFMPRSGSFTTYYAQYVGGFLGGDDSFLKFEFSWARYQPAIGSAVYATRLKAGLVKEFGSSTEVPLNDRFYLGGANSIRGFKENSIGPRDLEGTNVGAQTYAIFNQELRFPLFWKFWGSLFTDLGNGWESFSKVNPDNILFSYGVGLQLLSPAGPIRLDYAHRLENDVYREKDRFHVTILYAF
jgi:outer membrane protein insertion porin family